MTGLLDTAKNEFYGRPTYVLQMPDGALLVSDEQNGAIYRISYSGRRAPPRRRVAACVVSFTSRWRPLALRAGGRRVFRGRGVCADHAAG